MTTIDGTRAPGTVLLDGATLDRLDALSVATGRTPAELVRLAVAEFPLPAGAPSDTTATVTYVDPDGDTLALVPLEDRPADWAVRITTADPEGELDVFIEDDETLAGLCRAGLGAIEDRRR